MIKKLNYNELINVIHPLPLNYELSKNGFPVVKKQNINLEDFNGVEALNGTNRNSKCNNKKIILLNFNYDKILNKYWNDPMKYLPKNQTFFAVCTPDFSIYPQMNVNEIKFNIYRNRWIGVYWQHYSVCVIVTIQWGDESTFSYCFEGVEKGSIVAVSTIGCLENECVFLKGFNEMKRIIEPKLILVFGKIIDGMTGIFVQYEYIDSFNKNPLLEGRELFNASRIRIIKEREVC